MWSVLEFEFLVRTSSLTAWGRVPGTCVDACRKPLTSTSTSSLFYLWCVTPASYQCMLVVTTWLPLLVVSLTWNIVYIHIWGFTTLIQVTYCNVHAVTSNHCCWEHYIQTHTCMYTHTHTHIHTHTHHTYMYTHTHTHTPHTHVHTHTHTHTPTHTHTHTHFTLYSCQPSWGC